MVHNQASTFTVALALFATTASVHFVCVAGREYGESVRRMQTAEQSFRPPAVPLIVTDPFLSMWSRTDNAYDAFSTHWAGKTSNNDNENSNHFTRSRQSQFFIEIGKFS